MARCKICSKLVIMKSERHHWFRSGVFIVNFEHISHFFLVFLLLTLMPTGYLYLTVQFQHTFFYFDKLQSFSEWIPDGEKYSWTIHGVYWIREWGMVIVDSFCKVSVELPVLNDVLMIYSSKKRINKHVLSRRKDSRKLTQRKYNNYF